MKVEKNKVVSIDYTLTDSEGKLLDQSAEGEPLAYIHGVGGLIPGLEQALEGKASGDAVQVAIPPTEAYGEKDDALVQPVPRNAFPSSEQVEVGMRFRAQSPDGGERIVTVVDVNDEAITVDANHPLAGVTLHFDVTVVDVREATAEEIDHGHAHGPGGVEHE